MIKKASSQNPNSVVKARPAENRVAQPAKQTETTDVKVAPDRSTISSETKEKKAENLPDLNALSESLDGKTSNGTEKAENREEKKTYPPEVQQKLDTLETQLKDAEKRGDTEAVERIKKEIEELKNPSPKPGTEAGTAPPQGGGTPPAGGTPPGGGTAPSEVAPIGGGAPAGGGGAPAGGGGAPAGGEAAPGGGGAAPAGGGAPTGGANEAGAGQGAGKQEVDQFLQFAASAYGVNPTLLSEIARRESNFNTGDIANNWDSNARKGTPSKGMFQFIEPTFKSMMPQAKAANPGAWEGVSENWTDWKAQALTTAWAISTGKGSHWSTYKAALQTAGGNPRA